MRPRRSVVHRVYIGCEGVVNATHVISTGDAPQDVAGQGSSARWGVDG
jgi:hypothetical protein